MSNAEHNALARSIYCSFNWGAAAQGPRLVWLESSCPADKCALNSALPYCSRKLRQCNKKTQQNMLQNQKQKDQGELI